MMKCHIEADRIVGVTCNLTKAQADKFYKWAENQKQNALTIILDGVEGRAIVFVSYEGTLDNYLDDEPKSAEELENETGYGCWNRGDAKLWDNIKLLDEFYSKYHYFASVKIYPKSSVPEDVPADFISKEQVRYEDLKDVKDRGIRVPPFIANSLRTATNIMDFEKAEQPPEGNETEQTGGKPKRQKTPGSGRKKTLNKRLSTFFEDLERRVYSEKEPLHPAEAYRYTKEKGLA